MRFYLLQLLFVLLLSACAHPQIQRQTQTAANNARLTPASVIMPDGYVLPLKTWPSINTPTANSPTVNSPGAVVLAVHGFNDYSNAFEAVANRFAQHSITTYAID